MSPPPKRGRVARALIGVPLAGLLLTGCGAVNEAVTQGQQALDSASSAVEAAQGLLDAGAQLGAACAAAQAAWVPGVSADDAYAAIDQAAGLVDGVLAANPDFPAAAEIAQALASARTAVGSDEALMGMSRETLQTACALVSLGG